MARASCPLRAGQVHPVARALPLRLLLGEELPADAHHLRAAHADRYKYITYYGLWDADELYDLAADPEETKNLIYDPQHRQQVARRWRTSSTR